MSKKGPITKADLQRVRLGLAKAKVPKGVRSVDQTRWQQMIAASPWLAGKIEDESEDIEPVERREARCAQCKHGWLHHMHDQYGHYFKCDHCCWDSLGLYLDKNKFKCK